MDLTPSGIDLHNGHKYHVVIQGNGTTYGFTINDYQPEPKGYVSFSAHFPLPSDQVPIQSWLCRITGATGSSTGGSTILNWTVEGDAAPSPVTYPAPSYPNGFMGSTVLGFRGGAAVLGSAVQLTNGTQFTASGVFATTRVVPSGLDPSCHSAFSTDFDFQIVGGVGDGFAFVLQNQGLNALGTPGGRLGYGPATPGAPGANIGDSLAIKFDLHDNSGESPNSTGLYLNGASPTVPSIDLTSSGVHVYSGHPFHAQITSDGTTIKLSITDLTQYKVFTQLLYSGGDLPAILPAQAFAGFTAGTVATPSSIKIFNWTWTDFGSRD